MIDSGNGGLYYLKKMNKGNHEYILLMDKAYFPYGAKSKEFLLKRSFYLCLLLRRRGAERIVLACNTLSLLALPFLRLFFDNITGVFQEFLPYITENSVVLGSKRTIDLLRELYPHNLLLDGGSLISDIELGKDYTQEVKRINAVTRGKENLILACTHFLILPDSLFNIPVVKNMAAKE